MRAALEHQAADSAYDVSAHTRGLRLRKWGWLVLFTSTATLVCCVIPIVLVSLGLGAAAAAFYTGLPFLSFVALHKEWAFGLSALVLALAAFALFRPGRVCPADSKLTRACRSADKWNRRLFFASISIWSAGFFAAYLLLPLWQWLGFL
jgi:hypothetical protein